MKKLILLALSLAPLASFAYDPIDANVAAAPARQILAALAKAGHLEHASTYLSQPDGCSGSFNTDRDDIAVDVHEFCVKNAELFVAARLKNGTLCNFSYQLRLGEDGNWAPDVIFFSSHEIDDPAHDAGNPIGAAKIIYSSLTSDLKTYKQGQKLVLNCADSKLKFPLTIQ